MNKLIIILLAFSLLFIGSNGTALSLSIDNSSFEDDVTFTGSGDEGEWSYTVPSWSQSGKSGVFDPTDVAFDDVPDGSQTVYLNSGYVYQEISSIYESYNKYTFSMAVGNRKDLSFQDFEISLLAYNTEIKSIRPESNEFPMDGEFSYFDVSYTALSNDTNLGDNIGIKLENLSGEAQVNFDDVSLNTQTVPEHTTWLLFGTGLLGLAGLGRKKFFKKE